jgi:hypothetical protein
VTGFTDFPDFPTTSGALFSKPPCNGKNIEPSLGQPFYNDGFVAQINADGTGLEYSTYLGGCLDQEGSAIAVDAAGNAYVGGDTNSVDFPVTPDAWQTALAPGTCGSGSDTYACFNAFLIKLNPAATEVVYSTYFGGPAAIQGTVMGSGVSGVAADPTGHVYLAGVAGADFPTTQGAYQPLFPGGSLDVFVAKVSFSTTSLDRRRRQNLSPSGTSRPGLSSASSVRPPHRRMGHRLRPTVR